MVYTDIGIHMARQRNQNGWVEKVGKKQKSWLGHYRVYVPQQDGRDKPVHKKITLGRCAGMTKGKAEEKLRELIRSQELGEPALPDSEAPRPTRSKAEVLSLEQWWDRFCDLQTWGEEFRITITSIFRRHVLPEVGAIPLASVDCEHLQKLMKKLGSEGHSESLISKARKYLSTMFDLAMHKKLVDHNPAYKLKFVTKAKVCKDFYTQEQVLAIWKAALERSPRDYLILEIGAVGGLRPGEIFALRRDSWDEQTGNLFIRESVMRHSPKKTKETKTKGSAKPIVLSQTIGSHLTQWLMANPSADPKAYIFPSRNGTPTNPNNYQKRDLQEIAERAGVGHLTFQAFRRGVGSYLADDGIGGIKNAQGQLRHTRADFTADVYAQTIPASQRAAVERMDAMFRNATSAVN